jgi:hypothetical protein
LNSIWKQDTIYRWFKNELKKTYRYFYDNLSEDCKAQYKKIFYAMVSLETSVRLELMDVPVCEKIYNKCISDNPLFFYVENTVFGIGPLGITLNINYSMSPDEIILALKKIKQVLDVANRDCENSSDYEKEMYVHRYMVENVTYELSEDLPVHKAHSVFVNHKAVCDGISKAAKVLLDSVGIQSVVISGNSSHPNSPSTGGGHAWNMVWIEGEPYHVDFTFDNNLSDKKKLIRYDYFNLSDEQILRDHTYDDIGVKARKTNDWYRLNRLYFDKKRMVRDYLRAGIQKNSNYLGFRLPFTTNPDKTLDEMRTLIADEIKNVIAGSISYSLSINKEQMIIYIMF